MVKYMGVVQTQGQLGLVDIDDTNVPYKFELEDIISIDCGKYHTMLLTRYHEIYICGNSNNQSIPQKINLSNVRSINCGGYYNVIMTMDNKIYVWGNNFHGQLGLGDTEERYSPCLLNL